MRCWTEREFDIGSRYDSSQCVGQGKVVLIQVERPERPSRDSMKQACNLSAYSCRNTVAFSTWFTRSAPDRKMHWFKYPTSSRARFATGKPTPPNVRH